MARGKTDDEVPRERILEERPKSLSEPLPREKLPKDLQKLADRDDDFWEQLYDGQYDPRPPLTCRLSLTQPLKGP